MSIIELAILRATAGHGDAFADALTSTLSSVAGAADGCLGASALRSVERPEELALSVEWVSVAAHEDFQKTDTFAGLRPAFQEHLDEVVSIAHYSKL